MWKDKFNCNWNSGRSWPRKNNKISNKALSLRKWAVSSKYAIEKFSFDIKKTMEEASNFFDSVFYSLFLTNLYYFHPDTDEIEEILLDVLNWKEVAIFITIVEWKNPVNASVHKINSPEALFALANDYDHYFTESNSPYEIHLNATSWDIWNRFE